MESQRQHSRVVARAVRMAATSFFFGPWPTRLLLGVERVLRFLEKLLLELEALLVVLDGLNRFGDLA
jgi:hypothetical protein